VTASVLAIILAMRVGFHWVVLLGSATYFLGWLAIRGYLRRNVDESELPTRLAVATVPAKKDPETSTAFPTESLRPRHRHARARSVAEVSKPEA